MSPLIPPRLKKLAPYVPGRLIEEVAAETGLSRVVKLASNENSLGPSPKALEAAREAMGSAHRYGDAAATRLRRALSERLGHPQEGIVCGNGSSEFILLLAHGFAGDGLEALMSKPSFTLYAKNVEAAGARAAELPLTRDYGHDLESIRKSIGPGTRLVFLDNPLNPTGAWLEKGQVEELSSGMPEGCLLVLDEAYADFARAERPDYGRLLARGKSTVVLRTFSKIYGLAGLRAAYALMSPELAEALNAYRQPFNVSSLAQAAALAALSDERHLELTLSMTWGALSLMARELPALGLPVWPTQANFVMAGSGPMTADALHQALLREGVIVRSLSSFGLPDKIRVNAGTEEEMGALLTALGKALPKGPGPPPPAPVL
jgi:histidinol-phosphate aminotransferase